VGRNCRVGADIKEEDFSSLVLENGESIEKPKRNGSEKVRGGFNTCFFLGRISSEVGAQLLNLVFLLRK
jgi:hypothetical protein